GSDVAGQIYRDPQRFRHVIESLNRGVALGSRGAHETAPVHIAARRRVGVLMSTTENDVEGQARLGAVLQGVRQAGWAVPGTVRIDTRWGGGDAERIRKYAAELVALAPDVILASGGAVAGSLLQATRTVPIVFTLTPDPVGAGFVESLA